LVQLWQVVGWRRLVVTGLCLAAWRGLEQIPVPGLSLGPIASRLLSLDMSTPLHAIGSSGPLATYSIVAMGIAPYINALIVMTLLQAISARIRRSANNDDGGQRLRLWTRGLAIAFALGQAYGWTQLMQQLQAFPSQMEWFSRLLIVSELTAGTMVLVWLADIIDEHGLGFGNGAIAIYAFGPVSIEAHRLAAMFATAPSGEALYRPVGVWAILTIAVVAATVAVLRGVRRVPPVKGKKARAERPVELKVLMSGVLRPPTFALAALSMPVTLGNYLAVSNPGVSRWIADVWTPYGLNPWTNLIYILIDASLVFGFTYFVVACDLRGTSIPGYLAAHINRLTLIGGIFLVLTVVVMPVLDRIATRAAGMVIPLSGFDVVLVVAVLLAIIGSLEQPHPRSRGLPVLLSRLP
jgi:preprotein translocase subunit SecY